MAIYQILKELEREQEESNNKKSFSQRFLSAKYSKDASNTLFWAKSKFSKFAKVGGKVAWIVATSCLITIVPLIIEIEREQVVIETEKLQIKDLKSQGYTQAQIRQMGFQDHSTLKTEI